jgi:hypothetical protein
MKVRGYKTVLKYFSHQVAELEPVLASLEYSSELKWETRFILLVWLSLLCRVPFDLNRVGSGTSLFTKLFETGFKFCAYSGKEREGAAELLGRLFTRKDTIHEHLRDFLMKVVSLELKSTDAFLVLGLFHSLCLILKYGSRLSLIEHVELFYQVVGKITSNPVFMKNSLIRKFCSKLTQRIAITLLPPRTASWRYQRGHRVLDLNFGSELAKNQKPAIVDSAKQLDTKDDLFDVPLLIDHCVDYLLRSLGDNDTVVRWSAAKGLGRIVQRLPQDFGEEVVDAVVNLFGLNTFINEQRDVDLSQVSDQIWHGAFLTLAELARRGLLLPQRLEKVIDWVSKGLVFEQRKDGYSAGQNVRDASCYVCWSFGRAYAPEIMQRHVQDLAPNLICTALFDREVNVRRAASAAFQENVGRQGVFPHGIEIVTAADFFTLGSRKDSFLAVAPLVAKYEEYVTSMMDHLVVMGLRHWDAEIRLLSSKTLSKIARNNMDYFLTEAIPQITANLVDLEVGKIHGSLLALGEIMSITDLDFVVWLPKIIDLARKEVASVEAGHENDSSLVEALCGLMTSFIITEKYGHILSEKELWYSLAMVGLQKKSETCIRLAADLFGKLVQVADDKLVIESYLTEMLETNSIELKTAIIIAFGSLEASLFGKNIDLTIEKLTSLIEFPKLKLGRGEAEMRKECVLTIFKLAKSSEKLPELIQDVLEKFFTNCLNAYATDSRGDVSSWIREAAMTEFVEIIRQSPVSKETLQNVIGLLLKQSLERIDKIRKIAVRNLKLLSPNITALSAEFGKMAMLLNSLNENDSYDKLYATLAPLVLDPTYQEKVLLGFVASAGGLTESLAKASQEALSNLLQKSELQDLTSFTRCLAKIGNDNIRSDRIFLPWLELTEFLVFSNIFDSLAESGQDNLMSDLLNPAARLIKSNSKSIRKINGSAKLIASLVILNNAHIRNTCFEMVVNRILLSEYPLVRKATVEKLYLAIGLADNFPTLPDAVEDALLSTDWEAPVTNLEEPLQVLRDFVSRSSLVSL